MVDNWKFLTFGGLVVAHATVVWTAVANQLSIDARANVVAIQIRIRYIAAILCGMETHNT